MELTTKDYSKTIQNKDLDLSYLAMVILTKETMFLILNRDKVILNTRMVTITRVHFQTIRSKDLVFFFGKTVPNMRGIGNEI